MASERPPQGEQQMIETPVIPFGRSYRRRPQKQGAAYDGGRVIRPLDVVILLPFIVPVVAAILLGLLSWFVAWLMIVGTLVAAIVVADLARRLRRRNGRALDRQAMG
jgi:hypothetical protein